MGKVTKKRWTPYEDKVVRSHVKKHPENLHYCFFMASKELDRSPAAIEVRYYHKLRKETKGGTLFTLFSKFKNLFNVKIQQKDYGK